MRFQKARGAQKEGKKKVEWGYKDNHNLGSYFQVNQLSIITIQSEKEPSRYPWRNEQASARERYGKKRVSNGRADDGSRRVQAVGGVPGLEGMRVEQLG
ncbi:hypothetical protein DBV15_09638 [Temnothorax longispinosus]|uniref:Uncharacterized protein n=1 Tax=Temnothorax longispinosus TaxID=300112 RepID=A0A4S2KSP0_9HYME|nr:hypothetical protein DBV15_09638 [Temnothorax longispinosus]